MIVIHELVWDDWNVPHISRHDVTPEEVEEVCRGRYVAAEAYAGRAMLIGSTAAARMLAIILAPRGPAVYYVVTARPASRKERALYRASPEEA